MPDKRTKRRVRVSLNPRNSQEGASSSSGPKNDVNQLPVNATSATTPASEHSENAAASSSPTKNKSPRSDRSGANSPEQNCAICLGKLENKSFTDSCLHMFCFVCLLEWSKVKPVCPLCQQQFKRIIHNVRSFEDFEEYEIPPEQPSWENPGGARFRYRTTLTQNRLFQRFERNFADILRPVPSTSVTTRSQWRYRRQNATADFRRRVYQNNMWVQPNTFGRIRSCSAEFYVQNPATTHRLIPWLNRELLALLNNSEHVHFLLELIIDLIKRFDIQSQEFLTHIQPYIGVRTEHFVHEFFHFARSPYDMATYDEHSTYDQPQVINDDSSDSNDSDVMVISQTDIFPNVSTLHNYAVPSGAGNARYALNDAREPPAERHGNRDFPDVTPLILQDVHNFLSMAESLTDGARRRIPQYGFADEADTAHSGWESPTPGTSFLTSLSDASHQMNDLPLDFSQRRRERSERNESAAAAGNDATLDSDGNESDVQIVGYEKPRAERTPPTPILISSDSDECIDVVSTHIKKKKKHKKSSSHRDGARHRRERRRSRSRSHQRSHHSRESRERRSRSRHGSNSRRTHGDSQEWERAREHWRSRVSGIALDIHRKSSAGGPAGHYHWQFSNRGDSSPEIYSTHRFYNHRSDNPRSGSDTETTEKTHGSSRSHQKSSSINSHSSRKRSKRTASFEKSVDSDFDEEIRKKKRKKHKKKHKKHKKNKSCLDSEKSECETVTESCQQVQLKSVVRVNEIGDGLSTCSSAAKFKKHPTGHKSTKQSNHELTNHTKHAGASPMASESLRQKTSDTVLLNSNHHVLQTSTPDSQNTQGSTVEVCQSSQENPNVQVLQCSPVASPEIDVAENIQKNTIESASASQGHEVSGVDCEKREVSENGTTFGSYQGCAEKVESHQQPSTSVDSTSRIGVDCRSTSLGFESCITDERQMSEGNSEGLSVDNTTESVNGRIGVDCREISLDFESCVADERQMSEGNCEGSSVDNRTDPANHCLDVDCRKIGPDFENSVADERQMREGNSYSEGSSMDNRTEVSNPHIDVNCRITSLDFESCAVDKRQMSGGNSESSSEGNRTEFTSSRIQDVVNFKQMCINNLTEKLSVDIGQGFNDYGFHCNSAVQNAQKSSPENLKMTDAFDKDISDCDLENSTNSQDEQSKVKAMTLKYKNGEWQTFDLEKILDESHVDSMNDSPDDNSQKSHDPCVHDVEKSASAVGSVPTTSSPGPHPPHPEENDSASKVGASSVNVDDNFREPSPGRQPSTDVESGPDMPEQNSSDRLMHDQAKAVAFPDEIGVRPSTSKMYYENNLENYSSENSSVDSDDVSRDGKTLGVSSTTPALGRSCTQGYDIGGNAASKSKTRRRYWKFSSEKTDSDTEISSVDTDPPSDSSSDIQCTVLSGSGKRRNRRRSSGRKCDVVVIGDSESDMSEVECTGIVNPPANTDDQCSDIDVVGIDSSDSNSNIHVEDVSCTVISSNQRNRVSVVVDDDSSVSSSYSIGSPCLRIDLGLLNSSESTLDVNVTCPIAADGGLSPWQRIPEPIIDIEMVSSGDETRGADVNMLSINSSRSDSDNTEIDVVTEMNDNDGLDGKKLSDSGSNSSDDTILDL